MILDPAMSIRRATVTILVAGLSAVAFACTPPDGDQARDAPETTVQTAATAATNRALTLAQTARATIRALAERDFNGLGRLVHPVAGVRFSPYAHVDLERDVAFSAEELATAAENDTSYNWGYYDGSGKPIELTFQDYYDRFIYDVPFADTAEVGYNTQIGSGNTINNVMDAYPDSVFVEYHVPGINPDYGGMDWRSLRLVFRRHEDMWHLVGIAHDQWTI